MQSIRYQTIRFPKRGLKLLQNTFIDILNHKVYSLFIFINFADSLPVMAANGLSTDFQNNKD